MHEASYRHMARFVEKHLDRNQQLKILDVGSCDINGSYRPLFNAPGWVYSGLDVVAGKNVDIVASEPYCYPVESGSFDVVVSGQALEHIEDTVAVALEMARALRPGGVMCVIAPCNFAEHRYPIDCWRFYPDGFRWLFCKRAGLLEKEIFTVTPDTVAILEKARP
jgi:SAM-dependent methyltransferase